jgi:hypothetical protein
MPMDDHPAALPACFHQPGGGPLADQGAFELCDGAEHMEGEHPAGVVVSMLSVSDTSPIFSRSSSSAVAISLSERARRSSFQTTSVSPARRTSLRMRASRAGRRAHPTPFR